MCLPCSYARVSWLCCSELSLRVSQVDDTWRPLWGRSRAQTGRDPMILPPRPQSPWQPATMLPSFCFSTGATSHLSQFRPLHINSYNFHLSWKRCQYHFVFRKYFRKKKKKKGKYFILRLPGCLTAFAALQRPFPRPCVREYKAFCKKMRLCKNPCGKYWLVHPPQEIHTA